MKKHIVTVLSLISGMYACAMPKYLEKLPEASKIRELYEQQKANTTDDELLENLEELDHVIGTLIKNQYQYKTVFDSTRGSVKARGKDLQIALLRGGILYLADAIIINVSDNMKNAKTLITQEQEFLKKLFENEVEKLEITG